VKFALGGNIGRVGSLRSLEIPKPMLLAANDQSGAKTILSIFGYSHVTGFGIGLMKILAISALIDIAKIGKYIVDSIAVNVVDLVCWPSASHIKPRQAMRQMTFVSNGHFYISTTVQRSRNASDDCVFVDLRNAPKNPCFWIVGNNRFEKFLGDSHS
jgi:hypothetical protein